MPPHTFWCRSVDHALKVLAAFYADDKLDSIFSDLRITARFPSKMCKERIPGSVIFKEDKFSSWLVLLGIILVLQKETGVRYLIN